MFFNESTRLRQLVATGRGGPRTPRTLLTSSDGNREAPIKGAPEEKPSVDHDAGRRRAADLDPETVQYWQAYCPNLPQYAPPDFDALQKTSHSRRLRFATVNGVRIEKDKKADEAATPRLAMQSARRRQQDEKHSPLSMVPTPRLMSDAKLKRRAKYEQLANFEGKICRFQAVVNDMYTEMYERRHFLIDYYLQDDTLAVHEIASPERLSGWSGREPSIWFRRGKCRRAEAKHCIKEGLLQPLEDEECIALQDFQVGKTILLNGQEFYIYDAAPFAREFFSKFVGVELAQLPADVVEKVHRMIPSRFEQKQETSMCSTRKMEMASASTTCTDTEQRGVLGVDEGDEMDEHAAIADESPATQKSEDHNAVGSSGSRTREINSGTKPHGAPGGEQRQKRQPSKQKVENMSPGELARLMCRLIGKLRKAQATLRETFRYFDVEKDHVLCPNDFHLMLVHYGYSLTEEDQGILFNYMSDRGAPLSFRQFVKVVSDDATKDVRG
ncbi:unnamed protein product [Amoebophrya sp. A25]|nr:unnamed protein product [Amoebophrya sp. A25]|eukprot:GSA25T00011479001.1